MKLKFGIYIPWGGSNETIVGICYILCFRDFTGRILKSGGHVCLVLRKSKYPLFSGNFRPMRLKFGMYVPWDGSKQTTAGILHIANFYDFTGRKP